MPKLALLTAVGGPIALAQYPLTTPAPGRLTHRPVRARCREAR
jgi:hypothetical protein